MQVCNCNGVSKAAIGDAVAKGCKSPKSVDGRDARRHGLRLLQADDRGSRRVVQRRIATEEDLSANYYVPTVPLDKPGLVRAVREKSLKSVSSVFRELGGGVVDPQAKPALASLLATIWADEYEDERDARFINDRVHGNIQKDGTFSVVPEMAGGVCTPAELKRIAEVAVEFNVPLVKLTGGQRIDLVGIPKEQLPAIWSALGIKAGYAWGKSYRTCKSCIGIDFCRFGLGDAMGFAQRIEKRFRGIDSPGKLKLATAGCPRNCSEAYVKDVGFVAIEGGRWEIYTGGAAGAHIRKGDLLCTVETEEEAMLVGGRYMQYYRETAKWKERTYTFNVRIGIERIRAVVVEDSDGICAALDAAMQKSIDATYDPWLEAVKPRTANQFADKIPAESDA